MTGRCARACCRALPALFLLLGGTVPAAAVTAAVRADTTWSGVVELGGDITILPHVTLSILPGTVVRIAKNWDAVEGRGAVIDVRGTLLAQGSPADPIVFCSAGDPQGPGDWGGSSFTRPRAGPAA